MILHCMYIPHFVYLFVHQWTLQVSSTFWLWSWVYKYLFVTALSSLGIYPEVEFLDHVGILFLMFWGTAILFSIAAAVFHIPTSSAQQFQFFPMSANNCYFLLLLFLIVAIPVDVKCVVSWAELYFNHIIY